MNEISFYPREKLSVISPKKAKETLDRERGGPAQILRAGAKDINCHVEEKDTADDVDDVSLVLLPPHRSGDVATGESDIRSN